MFKINSRDIWHRCFFEAPYGSETVQRLAPAEAKIFVPRSKIQFSKKFPSLFRKKLLYLK